MPRCLATTSTGPCTYPSIAGSEFCRKHSRERDRIRGYRISDPDLAESAREHASGVLHDLTDQVGLMRALIEQRINLAESPAEQVSAFNSLTLALGQLTKMTESLVKLSKDAGILMAREEVEELVDHVIDIVSEELRAVPGREEIVDRICDRINIEEGE